MGLKYSEGIHACQVMNVKSKEGKQACEGMRSTEDREYERVSDRCQIRRENTCMRGDGCQFPRCKTCM